MVKGKASTILNLSSLDTVTVTATASLDNQTVNTTGIISTGVAVLNITSTAIDNSTGLPLNTTYNIPLNESVTWLSIVWIPTTISGISNSAEELQVILDGTIVLDRFIYNTNGLNNDTINFTLSYPGVSGLNLTVTDPNSANVTNLEFPGDFIERTSQITYTGSPYEGVKSFAIATTKVTNDILQYWIDQYSNYENNGTMGAVYGTFLASLLVEYFNDQTADNMSSKYNVTWSRTSPIIVSVCEDPSEIYITLECDHSMGMTVVGTYYNMWTLNYICSSAISLFEYKVITTLYNNFYYQSYLNGTGCYGSVLQDLMQLYLYNNTSMVAFVQDGYIIEKSVKNDEFLVIDLETGIVRDINTVNNVCGIYSSYNYVQFIRLITTGFYRSVSERYEICNLGTYTFYWDGEGDVILSNLANSISADDQLVIIGTNKQSMTLYYGGISSGPGVSITSILDADAKFGIQNIQVAIEDLYDVIIGCSQLCLFEVNGAKVQINNITDLYNLSTDLATGKNTSTWIK